MALHEKFGKAPLDTILSAAIAHAEEGFPVSEITSLEWLGSVPHLLKDANAAATYLPDGHAPAAGEVFRNPDLARTLRAIVRDGGDGFYKGEIARRILKCSEDRDGAFTAADLAEYTAEWVTPLTTNYRGWDVYEIPPNSQGIAALVMLNILEGFPIGEYGRATVDTLHTLIEAKKLAYADMQRHVGDPRFSKLPVEAMLSKAYARGRAALINPRVAAHDVAAGTLPMHGGDTTYLCAVDAAGNMVSLIQSVFANFGSGVVPDGAGFALQSRGGLFTFDRAHPNALAPRKRPLQTVIPAFMKRDHLRVGFGVMGGWNQPQAHVQVISNIVDHGLNIQQALEAPRFVKLTFAGTDVMMESRFPQEVRDGLARRGHQIDLQGEFSNMVGGGQAVMRDARAKVNSGGSDPRKDGAAIPEPLL
jgi:gamma-glutamyltranspeptidase/glutathione hydrolase